MTECAAELGTIEKNKRANLVLLDANPLADIRNTQKIAAVILQGRLLTRNDLDGMLADALRASGGSFRPPA
jgi:imidazolonepropionase-like amidohydrolase